MKIEAEEHAGIAAAKLSHPFAGEQRSNEASKPVDITGWTDPFEDPNDTEETEEARLMSQLKEELSLEGNSMMEMLLELRDLYLNLKYERMLKPYKLKKLEEESAKKDPGVDVHLPPTKAQEKLVFLK